MSQKPEIEKRTETLKMSAQEKEILNKFSESEIETLLTYMEKECCSLRIAVRDNFPERY
jgi:hypothetical protein